MFQFSFSKKKEKFYTNFLSVLIEIHLKKYLPDCQGDTPDNLHQKKPGPRINSKLFNKK